MPSIPGYDRRTMPGNGFADSNPEMANAIAGNPVFTSLAQELAHEREVQAMKWNYTYTLSGDITGGQTLPFHVTIEQGTDFKSMYLTASAFSYSDAHDTAFPIPNSGASVDWAGRGLAVMITDTRSGRTLTSNFVAFELLATPGYGLNFQAPYPFRYLWYRNSKIKFDIRCRDKTNRTHYFEIALNGYKIMTPE